MKKKVIRLTEGQLRDMISKVVSKITKGNDEDKLPKRTQHKYNIDEIPAIARLRGLSDEELKDFVKVDKNGDYKVFNLDDEDKDVINLENEEDEVINLDDDGDYEVITLEDDEDFE